MTPRALIDDLRRRGVVLLAVGDRLRVNAPAGVLTPELCDLLRLRKPALLAALAEADDKGEQASGSDAGLDKLTPAERSMFPTGSDPPEEFLRAVLMVREQFDGEIVDLYLPEFGPLIETGRGYLTPAKLPEDWREVYEERAAIREFDGGQTREHAEAEALREAVEMWRKAARKRNSSRAALPLGYAAD